MAAASASSYGAVIASLCSKTSGFAWVFSPARAPTWLNSGISRSISMSCGMLPKPSFRRGRQYLRRLARGAVPRLLSRGLAGSVAELGSRYHLQGGGIGPAWRGSLASMGCSRGRGSGRTDRSRVLCGNRADTIPAGAENDSRKRLARPAPSGIAFQSGRRGHALSLGTSPRHRNTFP
jgi:hypothetical protein